MISESVLDVLESCRETAIQEIREDLLKCKHIDMEVYFLDNTDDEPSICCVKSVYLKDNSIIVEYEDYGGKTLSDSIELFTIDTIIDILSNL